MQRTMEVIASSDRWPEMYAREAEQLRRVLGDEIVRIHHIGSTSVPGLAAKPVIDILVEVHSVEALDGYAAAMQTLGYEPRGEFGIPGRRYYPKGGDLRTHHVHAFASGDPHVFRHLAFRDYLRTHPECAVAYGEVKRRAAAAHRTDPEGYVEYKRAFVERTLEDAVHWVRKDASSRTTTEEECG